MDKNGDGKLSKDEFAGPPQAFDRLDSDKDGFVTMPEAARIMRQRRRSARAGPMGERLRAMDKNKDGKISKDEFIGPAALFERLDRNSDGFISTDELPGGRLGCQCPRFWPVPYLTTIANAPLLEAPSAAARPGRSDLKRTLVGLGQGDRHRLEGVVVACTPDGDLRAENRRRMHPHRAENEVPIGLDRRGRIQGLAEVERDRCSGPAATGAPGRLLEPAGVRQLVSVWAW